MLSTVSSPPGPCSAAVMSDRQRPGTTFPDPVQRWTCSWPASGATTATSGSGAMVLVEPFDRLPLPLTISVDFTGGTVSASSSSAGSTQTDARTRPHAAKIEAADRHSQKPGSRDHAQPGPDIAVVLMLHQPQSQGSTARRSSWAGCWRPGPSAPSSWPWLKPGGASKSGTLATWVSCGEDRLGVRLRWSLARSGAGRTAASKRRRPSGWPRSTRPPPRHGDWPLSCPAPTQEPAAGRGRPAAIARPSNTSAAAPLSGAPTAARLTHQDHCNYPLKHPIDHSDAA